MTLIQIPESQQIVFAVRLDYLKWEDTTGPAGPDRHAGRPQIGAGGQYHGRAAVSATPESELTEQTPEGPGYLRLGEILIERKKIEPDELTRALELQNERGDKLGKILVDMGLIAQRDVLAALSEQLGVPLVTIDGPPPSAPEIDGLSHRFLRQCRASPSPWPIRL